MKALRRAAKEMLCTHLSRKVLAFFFKGCGTYTPYFHKGTAQDFSITVYCSSPLQSLHFVLASLHLFHAVLVLCQLAFDQILYEKEKKNKCSKMSIIQWFWGCHRYQYRRLSSVWIIFFSHQSVRSPLFTTLESVSWRYPSGKHHGKRKIQPSFKKYVWMIVDSEEAVESGKSPQLVTLLVCQIMSKLIEWKKKMHSLCVIRHSMPMLATFRENEWIR